MSRKIRSVQMALDAYFHISQKLGSHILDYGLKYDDILLNKIAEGDIDILRLSLIHNDSKNGLFKSILGLRLLLGNEYISNNYKYYSDIIINKKLAKL